MSSSSPLDRSLVRLCKSPFWLVAPVWREDGQKKKTERTQDTSGHYNSKPKQETACEKSLTLKGRHHYLLIVIVIITSIAKTSLFGLWTVKRLPQDNSQPLPSLIYSSEIRHTCVPLYVQRSLRFKSLGCCMWSELHNSQTLISLIAGPMLIATHSLR